VAGRRVFALVAAVALAACASREKELQAVAKDWSMVIRASQVIPIYPLSEDLRPGDIFLVETPIQEQAKQYREDGFLPLDQHLGRLHELDYALFYDGSHGIGTRMDVPNVWVFGDPATGPGAVVPASAPVAPAPATGDEEPKRHTGKTNWAPAPRAAFPTYSFSVSRGGGLKLALPIQGIPVGLGLMKTDQAKGSVTLADAYTYGLSLDELQQGVMDWAAKHRELLGGIRVQAGREVYLRVVNRVYVTGRVVVSMTNAATAGAQAQAGESKEVELIDAKADTAETLQSTLDGISKGLNENLPGGTLRVAQASSRSVTLSETFERPLIVGYLGFDFPIAEDGTLGQPLATRERLAGIERPFATLRGDYAWLVSRIGKLDEAAQEAVYKRAAGALDSAFQQGYDERRQNLSPADAFSRTKTAWLAGKSPVSEYMREIYDALDAAWKEQ